ncbi:hypothetical protein LDE04_08720 [Lactobacillus delbrueckii subsp. lactis]|nr:hypothetical protein HMPREF5505_1924 [Lactobacillus delbrueckii subsp. lactis DSM 20072]GEA78692.1 hypothetical protein LDE04_08720 [Lactobacillus delbrueckii subsp. lactis]CDR77251.1 Putative uncharacterized protein [Lactobacillus delbrueckii subsp. lactis]
MVKEWWHERGCSVIIGVILSGLLMWFIWRYIDVIMFIVICGIISLFWLAFKVIDKILK